MIKRRYVLTILVALLLLNACNPKVSRECPPPPKEFRESDLIGTWVAIGSRGNNAIQILNDGRYKQIMNVEWQRFSYESDWRPWRTTYSDKGLPYLHLGGLLMCAYWYQMDCRTSRTGIETNPGVDTKDPFATEDYWYDFCERKWVETRGEGVFVVLGASSYYPRGINLVPFTKSPDTPTGPAFALQEP